MEKENAMNYEQLAEDIIYAMQCGKKVEDSYNSDIGTCNMDYCLVSLQNCQLDRLHLALVKANENVGMRLYVHGHRYKGCFAITPDTHSQGYPRTANAEEIAKVMNEKGWECSVYYVTD